MPDVVTVVTAAIFVACWRAFRHEVAKTPAPPPATPKSSAPMARRAYLRDEIDADEFVAAVDREMRGTNHA